MSYHDELGVLSRSTLRKLVKGGGPEQQPTSLLSAAKVEGERGQQEA
jgi:hypothetical protein